MQTIQLTLVKHKFISGQPVILNGTIFRQFKGAITAHKITGEGTFIGSYCKVTDTVTTEFGKFKLRFVVVPVEPKVRIEFN